MLLPVLLSLTMASSAVGLPLHATEPGPPPAGSAEHPLADPFTAGFRFGDLLRAEQAVDAEIERGGFPGAALAIGRWNRTVVERGIGHLGWADDSPVVDPDNTVYDLASLTKVVATTTAVMLLVEDGKLDLDAPVQRYLPEFAGPLKDLVSVRELLTHTSGLPAGVSLRGTPDEALQRVLTTPLVHAPGTQVEYSDLGFVVLFEAAQRAAGEPLYRLLDRRVFGPLGMLSTTFLPGEGCTRCAPTEVKSDGTAYRGLVHDPISRALGGVAGNAGLFSTAHDLSRFAAMLSNGGELDGVRVLKSATIHQFMRQQPGCGTRALGWDTPETDGTGAAGLKISPDAFGHTGFTGTSLWVDPERGTWTVLLANRTFRPQASNRIQAVRRTVHDWVALAADESVDIAATSGAR
jgi:CubicO group peptidase (beta-lactamase class C family)